MTSPNSNKIKELLSNGTPKQIALIIVKNSYAISEGREALITEDEEWELKQHIIDLGKEEEYTKWANLEELVRKYVQTLYTAYYMYLEAAQGLKGYLRLMEAYQEEEQRFNKLISDLEKIGARKEAITNFERYALRLPFNGAKIEKAPNGKLHIDIFGEGGLFSTIKEKADDCEYNLSNLKAYIKPFDTYMTNKKAKAFIPEFIARVIDETKKAKVADIAPKYTRTFLLKRKKRGEPITPEEERIAVLPDYEETIPDSGLYKSMKEEIRYLSKNL
jgi:hypothetical protein